MKTITVISNTSPGGIPEAIAAVDAWFATAFPRDAAEERRWFEAWATTASAEELADAAAVGWVPEKA